MTVDKKPLPPDLIDALLANYKKPEDLIGEDGLLKQLTKALVERALAAEMAEHLGHGKNEPVENVAGNTRNGKSQKTLKGEFGELPIEIPRDRQGSFEPQLVPKHQTRWTGFDDKILSLYARGMTVREIQAHLEEMYGTEVSPIRHRRGGQSSAHRVRRKVERRLPADRPILAAQLAAPHPVLRLPAGDPESDLYDQRHRVGEHEFEKNHQEPRLVPER